MKTLTTLSVAAVLAMGMSVAGAQTTMKKPTATGTSHYTVIGKNRFCSKTPSGTRLNCKFATMAACERVAKPKKGFNAARNTCVSNPRLAAGGKMNSSTTGSGTGMK